MTVRKVWLGSTGPFLYDDQIFYIDPDYGQSPYVQQGILTDGQIIVGGTPTDQFHVVRKFELDNIASTLNLGTMAYQNANNVNISGGTALFTSSLGTNNSAIGASNTWAFTVFPGGAFIHALAVGINPGAISGGQLVVGNTLHVHGNVGIGIAPGGYKVDIAGETRGHGFTVAEQSQAINAFWTNISSTGNRFAAWFGGNAPSYLGGTLQVTGTVGLAGHGPPGAVSLRAPTAHLDALSINMSGAAPRYQLDCNGTASFGNHVGIGYAPDGTYWLRSGGIYADGVVTPGLTATDATVSNGLTANVFVANGQSHLRTYTGIGGYADTRMACYIYGETYMAWNLALMRWPAMVTGITVSGEYWQSGTGAFKAGGGPFYDSNSQAKFKKNIRPIPHALETLCSLNGREWEWADEQIELQTLLPGTRTGLVVDEVAEVRPEWVAENKPQNGDRSLAISGFEALTVEALKQIVSRLEALEGVS